MPIVQRDNRAHDEGGRGVEPGPAGAAPGLSREIKAQGYLEEVTNGTRIFLLAVLLFDPSQNEMKFRRQLHWWFVLSL